MGPAILFVKPGSIRPYDKGRLHKAGVLVVEVSDPSAVNFVHPTALADLSHGELLVAAAKAFARSGTSVFGDEIAKAILAKHGGLK